MARRRIALVSVIFALLAGCGGGGDDPVNPTPASVAVVTVSPGPAVQLVPGGTAQLSATPKDANGNTLSRAVTWSSSTETVASVSSSGLVTALSVGTAQIRATSEGKAGETTITVAPVPVATIDITPGPSINLVPGGTTQLAAAPRDAQGNALSRSVSWSSTAADIASVSSSGLVTATSVGTVQIRATSDGKFAEVTVTVAPIPVASISLSATSASLVPSQPLLLTATARDAQGNVLAGRTVTWATSAPTVVTVNNAGTVTALTVGTATITASISVSPNPATVIEATSIPLTAILRDASNNVMTGPAISWSSSDATVATVSATGVVTGVLPGGPVMVTASAGGQSGNAMLTVKPVFPLSAIAVGADHACGINAAGNAWCWGFGREGQLGDGAVMDHLLPAPLSGSFSAIYAGRSHSCALTLAGSPFCWGRNNYFGTVGMLGDGTSVGRFTPVAVSDLHTFAVLTVGSFHSCGLGASGLAYCWGSNTSSALGDGSSTDRLVPVPVNQGALRFKAISAGDAHTCALTLSGQAYCWGQNQNGKEGVLGDGTFQDRSTPAAVAGGRVFASISAGYSHTCARTAAGAVWCWGRNDHDVLGTDAFNVVESQPVLLATSDAFTSIVSGRSYSCGLLASGLAKCWGDNTSGQLGIGSSGGDRASPASVSGAHPFTAIVVGISGAQTCAIAPEGTPWCWGRNDLGQLGDGTQTFRLIPTRVRSP